VFVLCLITGKERTVEPIGTAFAIDCSSKRVLLTAGHCLFGSRNRKLGPKNQLFCTEWIRRREDGAIETGSRIPVHIVHASLSPDICILARKDGQFDIALVSVCEPTEVPWVCNAGWECRVKCYHYPVDIFNQTDMSSLSCNVTDYHMCLPIFGHIFHNRAFFWWVFWRSNDNAKRGHKLLGILVTTQVTRADFSGAEYLEDSTSSGSRDVLNPSVSVTTAVVPALLSFKVGQGKNAPKMTLSAFLTHQGY
jgi:hypothetical protein